MSKDLTLAQMDSLGMSIWMSDTEVSKQINKALEEQQKTLELINSKPTLKTLDEVLVEGGDYVLKYNDKKYRIRVLTKLDMHILDNASNYLEEGIEYDIKRPYRYSVRNSHDNFVTIKCGTYTEAQQIFDHIYGAGLYKCSASVL